MAVYQSGMEADGMQKLLDTARDIEKSSHKVERFTIAIIILTAVNLALVIYSILR